MEIFRGGLRYDWNEHSLLTPHEAEYALEELWKRCSGGAFWFGEPVIDLPSISHSEAVAVFNLPRNSMPWLTLQDVTPSGVSLPLDTDRLPALFATSPRTLPFNGDESFPLDLVAATFLLLSRWEEINLPSERDPWGNYHSSYSLAARQNFLRRPVLDEWALVLRTWLCAKRPNWSAAPSPPCVVMTHDVDHPHLFRKPKAILYESGKMMIRRRQPLLACRTLFDGLYGYFTPDADPYSRAVDALMDLDESLGTTGLFYFMAADKGPFDEGYDLGSPAVRRMLDRIQTRGHQIGWHPSYQAAEDDDCFQRECQRFEEVLGSPPQHARHHYLRWHDSSAWVRLAKVGVKIDSTLGYNEEVGFRCGTCLPFMTWDLKGGRRLELSEQPLIAEDASLFQFHQYDRPTAAHHIREVWDRAKQVGGCFVTLIHNSQARGFDLVAGAFHDALQERSERCAVLLDSPLAA